jgi:hypothetical protein
MSNTMIKISASVPAPMYIFAPFGLGRLFMPGHVVRLNVLADDLLTAMQEIAAERASGRVVCLRFGTVGWASLLSVLQAS